MRAIRIQSAQPVIISCFQGFVFYRPCVRVALTRTRTFAGILSPNDQASPCALCCFPHFPQGERGEEAVPCMVRLGDKIRLKGSNKERY